MTRWDVFLSYSRDDVAIVERCAEALQRAGIRAWRDLEPQRATATWLPLKLSHALLETKVFCLFASENSWGLWGAQGWQGSPWVPEEYRAFAKRSWGLWSDNAQPSILVVRLPGFSRPLADLTRPPWSLGGELTLPVHELTMTSDEDVGSLVDHVRALVEMWREQCRATLRDRIRVDLEDSLRQQGADELMTYVMVQSFDATQSFGATLSERAETAERYWLWTRPKELDAWDKSVIASVLRQFDRLYIPSDFRWAHSDDDDDGLRAAIAELHSIGAWGYTLAALFAEAIASATANRYPSVNARTRFNEELRRGAPHHAPTELVVDSRSPVELLCNIGLDLNILSPLQGAYYACRSWMVPARDQLRFRL